MNPKLTLAISHHKAGTFVQAATLYRELLVAEPHNADALHLLGVLMHQIGQSKVATELIGYAIQINSQYAPYHNNLGNALHAIGDIAGARRSFERSITLDSRTSSTYVNLGNLENSQEDWGAAKKNFQAALRYSPASFDALFGLANLMMAKDETAAAIRWYKKAVSGEPHSIAALNALGNALLSSGDQEGAKTNYLAAAECAPSHPDAHINLGNVYMAQQQFDLAIRSYERAVHCAPSDRDAITLLGLAHLKREDAEEAMNAFSRALRLDPGHARTHLFLGHALIKGKHFLQSIQCFEETIRLEPTCDEAHNGLGAAYEGLGEYIKASAAFAAAHSLRPSSVDYLVNIGLNILRRKDKGGVEFLDRAIKLDPDHIDAHVARAVILLSEGDYELGWPEFEWRWRLPEFSARVRPFTQPLWEGQSLDRRVILLHAEQGYGDTIQFVRYVKDIVRLGGVIVLEVQSLLYRLLKQIPGVQACLRQGIDPLPNFDLHCPLMSLPNVLGTRLDSIPPPVELTAVAKDEIFLKPFQRLEALKVGIVWAGNPKHTRDTFRSIPFQMLLPFRELSGVTFVSLQKDVPNCDVIAASTFPMQRPLLSCEDFLDTARVIDTLDLVIGVDTSVAHLAASMGKPVWLMLPESADWRWGLEGEGTPWYPTMRLFRQTAKDGWADLVNRVLTDLAKISRTLHPPV
ncbi:tetratricopeptide repeat protein [Edaphobacter modestus]|uniref:Tetratricopeptide (TPR) repeat protein n=1 Tax=Edaphobacter modestus TaxID=388466 RepID=A0A4Q7YNR0_9BACT|nr:tetratricopeptide repeat protein [Edaphobacter modestus]RZU39402.1 tetratricopeptide (TPR) repeat protein [Edaphobacter modestus]